MEAVTKEIGAVVATIEESKQKLEELIYKQMATIAEEAGLDQITISSYGNSYLKGENEVRNTSLDMLDELYLTNVHAGGFEGIWMRGKGWNWE